MVGSRSRTGCTGGASSRSRRNGSVWASERRCATPVDVRGLQQKLAQYGYNVATDGVFDERTRRVFAAFQMHFRPRDYAGNPDAIAGALLDKYMPKQAVETKSTP